jgi:hypothetical protein
MMPPGKSISAEFIPHLLRESLTLGLSFNPSPVILTKEESLQSMPSLRPRIYCGGSNLLS